MYLLLSIRFGGWMLRDGTYGTDIAEARRLDESAAFAFAARHYKNGFSEFGLVPIKEDSLDRVREIATS